jgi:hypothetical protein
VLANVKVILSLTISGFHESDIQEHNIRIREVTKSKIQKGKKFLVGPTLMTCQNFAFQHIGG